MNGRYFHSPSNLNLPYLSSFHDRPPSFLNQLKSFNNVDSSFSKIRYLAFISIAIGITVITVFIISLPLLFVSLNEMKEHIKINGNLFKV